MNWGRLGFSGRFPDLPAEWCKSVCRLRAGRSRVLSSVREGQHHQRGPERGIRQKKQPMPSHEQYWKETWPEEKTTCLCVGKEDGIYHLFGEKVVFVREGVSNCLHGNRTQGADWFMRTGTDFGNWKRNDFALVDGGGAAAGRARKPLTDPPLPEKRSFSLGRQQKNPAETKIWFWATSRKLFEQERGADPEDTTQLHCWGISERTLGSPEHPSLPSRAGHGLAAAAACGTGCPCPASAQGQRLLPRHKQHMLGNGM